ncbi:MAG: CRTAC1 family protein [Planctomycetota bacterium]
MHRWICIVILLAACAGFCASCSGEPESGPKQATEKSEAAAAADPGEPEKPESEPDSRPWFTEQAQKLGIDLLNRTGEPGKKQFIMSAVGPGAAVFDADGDGLLDIYIVQGSWLVGRKRDSVYAGEDRPRNALYMQQSDGTFRNEAKQRGADDDGWGFGACAADLDNDGDQDLIVTNIGRNRVFVNDGKGHFQDISKAAGFYLGKESDVEWSTGIGIGDYDRDGRLDVYIGNYADMFEWMRNDPAIKWDSNGGIINAAVCEWQNLLVYCGPKGLPRQQDRLYRNVSGSDGELRFEDVTKSSGVHRSNKDDPTRGAQYAFQILFTDVNLDGWPDIYVSNDSSPSYFFENQRDGTFKELASQYQISLSRDGEEMAGMGADAADLNHDGVPEILKTNFALQTFNLYVSHRVGDGVVYKDLSKRAGVKEAVYASLGWGVLAFDYDNDGDRDLMFVNGHVYPEVDGASQLNMNFAQLNQLFRNDSTTYKGKTRLKFQEVTRTMGPGLAVQKSSRGLAMLDLHNDGDLDLVVVNLNETPDVLVNERGSESGHWIRFSFSGNPARKVNREAIGTRVKLTSGDLVRHFEIQRGRGFLGCNDPRLHVGLGERTGAVQLEIVWPNGDTETRTFQGVDRQHTVAQK